MKKNVASQIIGAQLISKTDGSAVTSGTTTVYVTGDGGTQAAGSVGSGACTHEGNGYWTYAPAQAETNYDQIAFTFVNTSACNATVQVYPTFPQTGDNFARLGAPAGASVSADVAAIKAETATILADTNDIQTRIPAALVSGRIDASVGAMAANVMTAAAAASDLTTELQSGLATAAALTTVGNYIDTEVASILAAVDTEIAAIKTVVDDILVDTAEIGAAGAGLTALATQASVNTIDDFLDTEIAAIKAVTDKLDTAIELDGAVYRLTTNALELAPTGGGGGGLDAAGVRAAIGLASANLDTQLAAIDGKTTNLPTDPADQSLIIAATNSLASLIGTPAGASVSADVAAVKAETATILADTNDIQTRIPAALVSGRIDASVGAMAANVMTAAAAASDLTAELQSGLATAANLATVAGYVDTEIAAIKAVVDDILVDTAEIGTAGAGLTAVPWNASWDAEVQSEVADALAVYDPPTNAEMEARTLVAANYATAAAVSGIPTTSQIADAVHDEVVDGTTTFRESTRLHNAVLAGIASGLETTEATFRDLADSKDRVVATVDADGNRTAVVLDLT